MIYKEVTKCNLDSKELFSQRDEDGYIVLDGKLPEFTPNSREKVGNENRIKNWIETKDGKQFLIKSNAKLDGEENYMEYAELICMKIAEKMGLEYAKYDIIKYNGEKGIITENMLNKDEYMFTLEDFISSSQENPDSPDIIDYIDTVNQLGKKLKEYNYSNKDSKKIIKEFNKRVIFDSIVGATDRHAENISFIGNVKNSKDIRLSPIYDTENSLLLENDVELVTSLAFDKKRCSTAALSTYPKLAIVPNKDADPTDITRATFEFSTMSLDEDDYELEDFAAEQLESLDMDDIFDRVENQINSIIPIQVKNVAKICVNQRIKDLSKMLDGRAEVDYDREYMNGIRDKISQRRENMARKEDISN